MEHRLVQRANAVPNATAVVDGDASISYRELIARADILVEKLHGRSIKLAEPVCILLDSGYQQIVSQVAVLRAGGTCVPIDPSMPSSRLLAMLHDINSRFVITSKALTDRVSDFGVIQVEEGTAQNITLSETSPIRIQAGCPETHRSHIFFTSGSTGLPKPIQVLACGVLHVLASEPATLLDSSDRMAGVISPGFDFSLFGIWTSLLAGGTVIQIPKVIVTDPFALSDYLKKNKITVVIIPTALFNVIVLNAPIAFRGLRHVLVGGEAVNVKAMKKVLINGPPGNLWNVYGPTEATIFVTVCRIDLAETQHPRISIGRAFGESKIYLLDEQLRNITRTHQTGEICVAGPQLSSGYLNRPEENEKQFIHINTTTLGEEVGKYIRLYRTGDLAQWRDSSGMLDYIGRADKQVKCSGHRVELGDVERTLERNAQVESCVVIQHKQGDSEVLAAYVVPIECGTEVQLTAIIDWAKEHLPYYMVPGSIRSIREFPLSSSGKVDRNALIRNLQKASETEEPEGQKPPKVEGQNDWLQWHLQELLNLSHIDPNEDIFSLGVTSLQAAQLIGKIKHHSGKIVTMVQLYANPTLESLTALLHSPDEDSTGPVQTTRWVQDSHLADDVVSPPDWQSTKEGQVFLTGAIGFLGAYLLHQLLSMPSVKKVACLARSRGHLTANDRIQKALEKYDLWDGRLEKTQKIMALDGDLTDVTLGLGEDKFTWLSNWASVIFHVGARVNWCEPYEALYGANVVGTRTIIRLTTLGRRKALHYVSSIDVWNETGLTNRTKRIFEDDPLTEHLGSLPCEMGYAQTQWVADEMVQRARARGLSATIYRPGFVIGDSSRGYGSTDDFFARLVVGCIQTRQFPHLPNQRLEYVTVDFVSSAILHIASKSESLGRSYHLVSPDVAQSVSIEETCGLINQAGYPVKQVTYQEWMETIQKSPGNPLESMIPVLQEPVLENVTRIEGRMYTPVFEAKNTVEALADRPDIKYVPLDYELLQRCIDFWVSREYYSLK
ncbi:Male sterility NAD-binding [Penicillium chrysogenum]|uniref:Male sterility NAD-binding n=1 Tax=Penicillium chrysogenum TaxID=5076 RepID=UPI00239FDA11|nr:Male sterility NAD-binding [Penicillium chrysogenum]KAJ5244375.1 Male sterility NAD-binding [Penicillium chrysogenum]KAJ5285489.1 Male sterility NAD-binding [Penicillium chrysogenum]